MVRDKDSLKMSEKAANIEKRKKRSELLLKTTLNNYKKVWLIGTKISRNEGWLITFAQDCMLL